MSYLRTYADLIIEIGLAVRSGDRVLISAPVEAREFATMCVEACYRHGAVLVSVLYTDTNIERILLEVGPVEGPLEAPPLWEAFNKAAARDYSILVVTGQDPYLLADVDPHRIAAWDQLRSTHLQPLYAKTFSHNQLPWTIVSASTAGWARHVFPDEETDETGVSRLWQSILSSCRLDSVDPSSEWRRHLTELEARARHLTACAYRTLRYRSPTIELEVGLPEGHVWTGGRARTPEGREFVINMPTEEVFTTPHRERVEGTMQATMPLMYAGTSIGDLRLTFSGGEVIAIDADSGLDTFASMLDTDPGARRLGEVALVPMSSPLARSEVVFHHMLFDENQGCHLAVGEGFRECIDGGAGMSDDEFLTAGGNVSLIHVDITVGSRYLDIDGVGDGTVDAVMRDGEWAFQLQ